jgi:hypothetical protein
MDSLTSTTGAGGRVAHGVAASAAGAPAAAATRELPAKAGSVSVAISNEGRALADDSAQGDAMTERLKKMREALSRIQALPSGAAQRKDAARARIQQLKERIEAMRQMMVGLSPAAAKAMAREIRAMAQELKQAAGTLLSGGGEASVGADTGTEASAGSGAAAVPSAADTVAGSGSVGDAVQTAAAAAQAAAMTSATTAEGEPAQAASATAQADDPAQDATPSLADVPPSSQPAMAGATRGDSSADADEDLIRKVAAALKELMAMVKAQMRDPAHDDDIAAAEQALGTTPGAGPG